MPCRRRNLPPFSSCSSPSHGSRRCGPLPAASFRLAFPPLSRWSFVLAGVVLAGPLVCATSQAVNDWYDRHVDAINEPNRPIPSGRIPGRWGFYIACLWTVLSLAVARGARPLGLRRRRARARSRLGLQRAAAAAEAERLVGQFRRRALLRRPALVHRRRRHGGVRFPTGASSRSRCSTASARMAS